MTQLPTITAQDTYDHIIGAFPLTYPWWGDTNTQGVREDGTVHSDWEMLVDFFTDIDVSDVTCAYPVNHHTLIKAIRNIAKGKRTDVSSICVKQCQSLLFKGDADFDAESADEVVQVATYGECIYS